MASYSQPAKLKSWLGQTGLRQSNFPLYQVIEQLINSLIQDQVATADAIANIPTPTGGGITELTTDVVAVGPGIAVATIQPDAVTNPKIIDDAVSTSKIQDDAITTIKIANNNVTYGKIQQVTGLRLVGNPDAAPADMVEIPLGDNLAFLDGNLIVEVTPGVPGILHRLLSTIHYDTNPDAPIFGDIIRAVAGPDFEGEYYHGYASSPIVEDFTGIRMGYSFGFHGAANTGNFMGYCPPELEFVTPDLPDNWLAWEYVDGFIQSLLVEDFTGIRQGYGKFFDYNIGNNNGYLPPELSFIVPPDPANEVSDALWERMAVGSDGQILTVVDGAPEWATPDTTLIPVVCPWEDIPFSAANFTADGGVTPTWTVGAGDVERLQYQVFTTEGDLANSVRIAVYLRETTVGGTAPTQLQIELPFSLSGAYAQVIGLQENLVSVTDAFVAYDAAVSPTTLFIQKIPFGGSGPAFDTTATGTFVSFEISAVVTDIEGCFIECGGGSGSSGDPTVPLPHHITHETGGTDEIEALAGEVITSGTVADARLSSNVALKDIDNAFSTTQNITGALNVSTDLVVGNDIQAFGTAFITEDVEADNFIGTASIFESSRAVAMGYWQDVAFSAGDYTGTGGGTWTVGAGAVVKSRYTLVGKTMMWSMYISWFAAASTVAGVVTALNVAIPGGFTSPGNVIYQNQLGVDAGAVTTVTVTVGTSTVIVQLASGAAFTAGQVGFIVTTIFEVN